MNNESIPSNISDSPDDHLDREALSWLVCRHSGLSTEEEERFQTWLAGDPARRTAFARWQAEWDVLDDLPADGLDILRKNLADDKRAMEKVHVERSVGSAIGRHDTRWNWMPKIAMVTAVFMISLAGWQGWDYWQQQPVFIQSLNTLRGQQISATLPDGSQLRLDTATSADITYFRQRREVRLPEGNIVFQVSSDSERPFDVLAGPLRITVVGTSFSVRYTPNVPGAEDVRVAVEEGRVRVALHNVAIKGKAAESSHAVSKDSYAVELTAGQQVTASAEGVLGPVGAVSVAGIAPWREGRVSFHDIPLAHVLAEFERYGPSRFLIRDPAVAALRLTGTFNPRYLDNFARVLPQVLPVRLHENAGMTEIISSQ